MQPDTMPKSFETGSLPAGWRWFSRWRRGDLGAACALRIAAIVMAFIMPLAAARPEPTEATRMLHYAPNHNFDKNGTYTPARAGFNVADVSQTHDLAAVGPDISVLVWVGLCHGVDETFMRIVNAYAQTPRLFGFYLMDDPDPRPTASVSNAAHACSVANLRAEVDWIHDHVPGAQTIIVIMNLGDASHPSFRDSYEPTLSHIDLFGLAAYPCRTELRGCDQDVIDRYVAAATEAGIPTDCIVPIYQTFGGGGWKTDTGGNYAMPTVQQAADILSRWHQLVPTAKLDMAYSWGAQKGDAALETAPELQALFARYNRSGSVE